MTAVQVLPPGAARGEEWLAARRSGVTASEIAAILGLSRWDSPLSLYFRKRGELDEDPDTDRLMLGRVLEPYVLERFADETGYETEPGGLMRNHDRPWQMATPDALIGGLIPAEAKTAVTADGWGPSGSTEIPLHYRCQLMWQCDTMDADHGYICVLFLRTGEPRWYSIAWDGEDAAVMREAAADFLRRVEDGDPPQEDASEATTTALRKRYGAVDLMPDAHCGAGLADAYRAARRACAAADEAKRLAENQVRVAMGTSTRLLAPDGSTVATRRVYERAGYTVKPAMVDAIYPGKEGK